MMCSSKQITVREKRKDKVQVRKEGSSKVRSVTHEVNGCCFKGTAHKKVTMNTLNHAHERMLRVCRVQSVRGECTDYKLLTLTSVPACILVNCPLLYWTSSDAAITPTHQTLPENHGEEEPSSKFSQSPPYFWAASSFLSLPPSYSPYFSASVEKRLPADFLHIFHHFISFPCTFSPLPQGNRYYL